MDQFPFLTRLEVLPEWEAAADRFLELGGVVLVLGAPDTGKSTLSRYLVYRAYAAGARVALVDLDLGQSHLGPPATLGLGLFPPRRPGDDSLFPDGLYFIGQTSPVGALLEVVTGCRVLVDQAAREGVARVVVNTSGLVQGPAALRLKRAQAELLQPSLLLGLERERELEPLLRGLGGGDASLAPPAPGEPAAGWPLLRLPVSSRAQRRPPEERRRYREEGFRRYFGRARRLELPLAPLSWQGPSWGQGEPLDAAALKELGPRLGVEVLQGEAIGQRLTLLLAEPPPGHLQFEEAPVHWLVWPELHLRLVGLLDGGHRTLALGLILPSPWNPEALAMWTPLNPAQTPRVQFLKVGRLRVSLQGQELT
jgi:polynucleotide 5'-hydroxyl-kinase GRC3/NOL9